MIGSLDVGALEAALGDLIERHEVLRTRIEEDGGTGAQIIDPVGKVAFRCEETVAWADLVSDEASRPFDLRRGPLMRALVARTGPSEHVLALTMHHIVSDGWSFGVLVRDLSALYEARSAGRKTELAPLPIQYSDYARWQRDRLSRRELLAAHLAYWKNAFDGAPTALELPTDHPRPANRTYEGATHSLSPSVRRSAASLEDLGNREGATLYMTLIGALQVLLARHSGQRDIVVGSPIAGRSRPELEGLVGFFVNTLAIRLDLSDAPSFRRTLQRAREATLGAFAHQELPFEKLVEELNPIRDPARSPLFQVMLVLQNAPSPALEVAGLRFEAVDVGTNTSKFEQTWSVNRTSDGLSVSVEYNTDLFDAETIARMGQRFATLLESIAANPDESIERLALVPDGEQRAMQAWHGERRGWEALAVHEAFEAQARRSPAAIAVEDETGATTYTELDAWSNAIAARLKTEGVRGHGRVGVCMERGRALVAALLGVLKSGAAYVPLEPSNPDERLRFMASDAGASVVLVDGARDGVFEGGRSVRVSEVTAVERFESARPRGDELAYVLYTSGTTGRPKGVEVTHAALANHMAWMQESFGWTPNDVFFQKTPFGFDASVWEFWAPLGCGGRLVMAKPDGEKDPRYLVGAMRERGVTVLQCVPSLWNVLAETSGLEATSLRHAFSGGEALSWSLVRALKKRGPWAVHNLYGPTEACIDATHARCDLDTGDEWVSLGQPIGNVDIHIADEVGQACPIGVWGELCIGGVCLARGYSGRPALTAERFVPSPWGDGARLYRTGDRVRRRADGTLEYEGRFDHQVKIRGHRIELREIESSLLEHEGIGQAVAVALGAKESAQLVAYFTLRAGAPEVDEETLRAWLRKRLPQYMVPWRLVALSEMPLTRNGKVDRKALPDVEAKQATRTVAPRTTTECRLAEIFSAVLGVERVSVDDDFFALGGHRFA